LDGGLPSTRCDGSEVAICAPVGRASLQLLACSVALLLTAPAARASDWYVDAVNGSDANSGTTPQAPFQTITRALAALPAPPTGLPELVHVAPGVYGAALGEVFPIRFQEHDAVQIVSTAGSAVTILDGGAGDAVLVASRSHHYGYAGPLTRIEGFTVRNAQRGLVLNSSELAIYLTCRDVRFTGLTNVAIDASSGAVAAGGVANGTFERVEIADCARGVAVATASASLPNHVNLTFTDCTIARSLGYGLGVADGQSNGATIACTRTRIVDNAQDGVRVEQREALGTGGVTSTTLADCLVARNGGAGVKVLYSGFWMPPYQASSIATVLQRCTVAGNAGAGLDAWFTAIDAAHVLTTLNGTILFGNSDDVRENPAVPSIANPSFCDVGDGDFAGSNGNVSVDPQFVDAAAGDFRLRFGSPLAETGDPATPAGALDLARNARPIDGDLDTLERPDVGAYELAPLFLATSGRIGTPLRLESFGPSGGSTVVYFSRLAPVAPTSTSFGEFDLNPLSVGTLFTSAVAPGPPVVFARPIPPSPALVGRTFSFQGRTTSPAAPLGAAYSNVVSFQVAP
jgi:hypothetical protein